MTVINGVPPAASATGASDPGFGSVLAPLARRYRHWLSLDTEQVREDRQEAAADVRSMPLILRMERETPPLWSNALAASCRAATALCLDPRSEPGGVWNAEVAEYVAAHIRKVTRRARAGHWEATAELPGLTVSCGLTQVRALVPGRMGELDKRVSRLQVGGTDLAVDLAAGPTGDPVSGSLLLLVPEHQQLTAGKLMAQTGHAGMIAAALLTATDPVSLQRWANAGLPVTVRRVTAPAWAPLVTSAVADGGWDRRLVAVRDAGFTEIEPGTVTVVADASTL